MKTRVSILLFLFSFSANAQVSQTKGDFEDKFRQLDEVLPTANSYRTASGAPGNEYWQQQADYLIEATLDEENKRILGSERITYTNNSPDTLSYLWIQLDQNRFRNDSIGRTSETAGDSDRLTFSTLRRERAFDDFEGGFQINRVQEVQGSEQNTQIIRGSELNTQINGTMMRVDLIEPLETGDSIIFEIDWEHYIINQSVLGGRGGYEYFEESDTYQFAISQWYPRIAAYTDYDGWVNKQFVGTGEFTLEFGDFEVHLTVPADHIVAST
ncbi:MAG: hypothetical protein ACO4AC_02815, partial [Pseudohongiellaceae bacterium]